MSTTVEVITPAKAQEYLRTSLGNRPISKVFVRSYADTMKKGAWLLNGVPIIFDVDGHLLDGHHRLEAVSVAGIPVAFDVRRGAPSEAFTTYDNGRHRTMGQILAMQRVKNYNMVGSIVVANERLLKSGRLYENNGAFDATTGKTKSTNSDYYELYRNDPEGFDFVAEKIVSLQSKTRIIPGSWAGGVYYYLTHTGGYTEKEVSPFFEALYDAELSCRIRPVYLLRDRLIKQAMSGRKVKAEMLWAYLAKTWNAYITGATRDILKYDPEREGKQELILRK